LPHSGHICPACGARQLLDLESFFFAFGRFTVLAREFGMIFQLIRCRTDEKVTSFAWVGSDETGVQEFFATESTELNEREKLKISVNSVASHITFDTSHG